MLNPVYTYKPTHRPPMTLIERFTAACDYWTPILAAIGLLAYFGIGLLRGLAAEGLL